MKSFDRKYLERLVVPTNLIDPIHKLGEHKGRQRLYQEQAPEILENLRQVAVIQSTESSNRLEGITADTNRIRDLVLDKTAPRDRSEAEIAGYRDVLNTIHQSHQAMAFSPGLLLQLHRDLMKYAGKEGGRWKSTSNDITETLPDGTKRIRFQPVVPHLTGEYMRALHEHFAGQIKEQIWQPLILHAFYVLDFLCIHPFLDGNGRMARLITVLLLYQNGFEVGRYISLERVIEQSKESYYDTLYVSSQGWHEGKHDIWPWTEYFIGVLLAAYQEFENRVGQLNSGRGSKTEMVLSAIDSMLATFGISELERACPGVSRDMIRKVLFDLRDQGKIKATGKGRGAKWVKLVDQVR